MIDFKYYGQKIPKIGDVTSLLGRANNAIKKYVDVQGVTSSSNSRNSSGFSSFHFGV